MSKPSANLREILEQKDWGLSFLREMDLVIAVNELESQVQNSTLYNSVLNLKVAEQCAALDKDLQFKQLGLVDIKEDAENPWKAVPEAIKFLADFPRGHWAVFRFLGGYDAYMSDGVGGVETASGHKFTKTSPQAPDLNAMEMYSHVLSYAIYLRRNQIRNRILEHSFKAADLKPGAIAKNVRINGKEFSKIELLEIKKGYYVGGSDAVAVKATRRGAKPTGFVLQGDAAVRKFGLEIVIPPEFDDVGNEDRLVDEFAQKRTARLSR